MTKLFEVGDTIGWSFEDDFCMTKLAGKTFKAEIVFINNPSNCTDIDYGVYAEYGQDLIPHNKCKLIKKKDK